MATDSNHTNSITGLLQTLSDKGIICRVCYSNIEQLFQLIFDKNIEEIEQYEFIQLFVLLLKYINIIENNDHHKLLQSDKYNTIHFTFNNNMLCKTPLQSLYDEIISLLQTNKMIGIEYLNDDENKLGLI